MKLCWLSFSALSAFSAEADVDTESLLQMRSLKKVSQKDDPDGACDAGRSCIIAGDPHIRTFDSVSSKDQTHCYGPMGDYYLVKTEKLQVAARYVGSPKADANKECKKQQFARVGGVVITGELVNGQTISIPSYSYKKSAKLKLQETAKLATTIGLEVPLQCAPFQTWRGQCLSASQGEDGCTLDDVPEFSRLKSAAKALRVEKKKLKKEKKELKDIKAKSSAAWSAVRAHKCFKTGCLRYKKWQEECLAKDIIRESDGVTVKFGKGTNVLRQLKEGNGKKLNKKDKAERGTTFTITLKEGVTVVVNQGVTHHVSIETPNRLAIAGPDEIVEGHCGNYDCEFANDILEKRACSAPVHPFDPCSGDGLVALSLGKYPEDQCGVQPKKSECSTIQFREFKEICKTYGGFNEDDEVEALRDCIEDCCQDREECPDKDNEDEFAHCLMAGDPHIKTFGSEAYNTDVFFPHADFYALKTEALSIQVRYSSFRDDNKAQIMGIAISGPLVGAEDENGEFPRIELPLAKGPVDGDEAVPYMMVDGETVWGWDDWARCRDEAKQDPTTVGPRGCTEETDNYKATFGYGFQVGSYFDENYEMTRGPEGRVNFALDASNHKIKLEHWSAPRTITLEFKEEGVEDVVKLIVNTGGPRQNMLLQVRGSLLGESQEVTGQCVALAQDKCQGSDKVAEEDEFFESLHPSPSIVCPEDTECADRAHYSEVCVNLHSGVDEVFLGRVVGNIISRCVTDCCQDPEDCKQHPTWFDPVRQEIPVVVTTTTTPAPAVVSEPMQIGQCKLTGDPHIKTFDRPKKDRHVYRYGDYWLVKSPLIWIQARYWATRQDGKSSVRAIAISEPRGGGRKLIAAADKIGGLWVGEPNLDDDLEDFEVHTLKDLNAGGAHGTTVHKVGTKYTFTFPWAEGVKVIVDNWGHFEDVFIEMPRLSDERGQSGHCGNFDGDPDVGDEPSTDMVEDDDLLFEPHSWNEVLEHDTCPEERHEATMHFCTQKKHETAADVFDDAGGMDACIADCCSRQANAQCSMFELTLNGEAEWKETRRLAAEAVKEAEPLKTGQKPLQLPGENCPEPAEGGLGKKCSMWGDPHFSKTFKADLHGHAHGSRGRQLNHYKKGLYSLFDAGDLKAQAFMCKAGGYTSINGLAVQNRGSVMTWLRPSKSGPPVSGHPQFQSGEFVNFTGKGVDTAFEFRLNGQLVDYDALGDAKLEVNPSKVPNSAPVKSSTTTGYNKLYYAQQYHLESEHERNRAVGPLCVGSRAGTFTVTTSVPLMNWLYEPHVTLQISGSVEKDLADEANLHSICTKDNETEVMAVKPLDLKSSIFSVRELYQLCTLCQMVGADHDHFVGCNPDPHDGSLILSGTETCTNSGQLEEASKACEEVQHDGFFEMCLIEYCSGVGLDVLPEIEEALLEAE